jgi:hypothetical protein
VVPIPTFAPICGSHFANVGIEGPLENVDSGGASDLTFAFELAAGMVANVKSAPQAALVRAFEMGYQHRGIVSQKPSRQLVVE